MKIKKWIIYGKLLKEYGKMKPMKKFSALDTFGKPVSRIGNAKWYDTRKLRKILSILSALTVFPKI